MRISNIDIKEEAVPICDSETGYCDVPNEDLLIDFDCKFFPHKLITEWTETPFEWPTGPTTNEEIEILLEPQHKWHEQRLSEKQCHGFQRVFYCFCDEQ